MHHRRLSRSTAAGFVDYYLLLGIEKTASLKEIKIAYYQKAKIFHPDLAANNQNDQLGIPSSASRGFISLVDAYETLMTPHKRAIYDQSLREYLLRKDARNATKRKTVFNVVDKELFKQEFPDVNGRFKYYSNDEGTHEHDREDIEEDDQQDFASNQFHVDLYKPYIPGMDTSSFNFFAFDIDEKHRIKRGKEHLSRLSAEFKVSKDRAIHGPQIPHLSELGISSTTFFLPWAFECEVRSDSLHEDIVQIVSGRQLLGSVKAVKETELRIAMNDMRAEIEHSLKERHFETHLMLEMHYFGQIVGRAVKLYSKKESCYIVKFFLSTDGNQHVYAGSVVCSDNRDTANSNLGPEASTVKSFTFRPVNNEPTHLIQQYKLFGVANQLWFRLGTAQTKSFGPFKLNTGLPVCEIRAQRAWYPNRETLAQLFRTLSPRSRSHQTESWYFEIARPQVTARMQQDFEKKFTDIDNLPVESHLPKDVVQSWYHEVKLAEVRHQRGGLDARIPVLFTAMCTP